MSASPDLSKTPPSAKEPGWRHVSARFHDGRQALTAFLALEGAEILSGAKPASLVNLPDRRRPDGHNFYRLWHLYGRSVLRHSTLEARILADRGDSLLLLLFRGDLLAELLERKPVQAILHRAGYPEVSDLDGLLAELQRRLRRDGFPHEIGVFLGYPLKDVLGFMGWARIPFTCQGPWKIYGRQEDSLRLAETHRQCRRRMVERLACCRDPRECLDLCRRGQKEPFATEVTESTEPVGCVSEA